MTHDEYAAKREALHASKDAIGIAEDNADETIFERHGRLPQNEHDALWLEWNEVAYSGIQFMTEQGY